MIIQASRWGNSLGIRIPTAYSKSMHIHDGSKLEINMEDGVLLVKPKKYDLDKMLQEMPQHDFHEDLFPDAGMVGAEIW